MVAGHGSEQNGDDKDCSDKHSEFCGKLNELTAA